MLAGVQATVTVGTRRLVARSALPELIKCEKSPLYEAETPMVPNVGGMTAIEHSEAEELVAVRLQTPPGVKETLPVGVEGVVNVSVTMAVQVLSCPMVTGSGLHDTVVVVVSRGTVSTLIGNVRLLVRWFASPA